MKRITMLLVPLLVVLFMNYGISQVNPYCETTPTDYGSTEKSVLPSSYEEGTQPRTEKMDFIVALRIMCNRNSPQRLPTINGLDFEVYKGCDCDPIVSEPITNMAEAEAALVKAIGLGYCDAELVPGITSQGKGVSMTYNQGLAAIDQIHERVKGLRCNYESRGDNCDAGGTTLSIRPTGSDVFLQYRIKYGNYTFPNNIVFGAYWLDIGTCSGAAPMLSLQKSSRRMNSNYGYNHSFLGS